MSGWAFVPNPAYPVEPRQMVNACHDGSPFITIICSTCQGTLHLHETQLPPADMEIGARCPSCRAVLVFGPGELETGFAQMRAAGWVA